MTTLKEKLEDLIKMSFEGKTVEAIQKYYADDVILIQPDGETFEGLDAVLAMEKDFFEKTTVVREAKVTDYVVNERLGTTWDISIFDGDHSELGAMKMKEISIMEWKDGKVKKIQFIAEGM